MMIKHHAPSVPHVEARDGAADCKEMQAAVRHALSVPKKRIDEMMAREKRRKKKRRT